MGMTKASPPPSPDGYPFAHMYWLAEENNETSHTTTKISLAPLEYIKDKLNAHISKHHRLGEANTKSGYWDYWRRLLTSMTSVNLTTSNSFWSNTRINVSQKRNVMKFRTSTLYHSLTLCTQISTHLYGRATNSSCLLCHQPDSQIYMHSSCQNASIQNTVTERHHIAFRLIIKTLNKGNLEETSFLLDIGWNTDGPTKSGLAGTSSQQDFTPMASTKPFRLKVSADELRSCSRPDAISILPVATKNGHQRDIQTIHPSRWDVHLIKVEYCDETRPEQQPARATEQHIGLKHALAQQCHKASLHTILIGVMGTIY